MGEFLSYSIQSGLILLCLYLAYRLFLSRDNQHGFNRGVLLLIYAVSFLTLPAVAAVGMLATGESPQAPDAGGFYLAVPASLPTAAPVWGTVLIWIYLAGMAVVAIHTAVTWTRLIKVIRSGERITRRGYTLVLTDDERFAPFSWMNYIVIGRKDYCDESSAIAAHEIKHVAARHWIDLLVAQAVCIVNWFNPVAWLMRDELMLMHEYQADMAVIDHGYDAREYQMLLIKKAVGSRFPSLANSLNHSKLKKRITMMYKEKSGAGRRLKALALVPMLALALGLASVPAVRAAVSTIGASEISTGKVSENKPQDKTRVRTFTVTNINTDAGKTTVVIKGSGMGNSMSVSGGTFTTKGKTYQATGLQCNLVNGEATIKAVFPFESEFKNSSMTLSVDGEEIPFELDGFFDKSRAVTVQKQVSNVKMLSTIVINDKSAQPSDVTIYLDGKEINGAELQSVTPDKIGSITIEKGAIKIATKK